MACIYSISAVYPNGSLRGGGGTGAKRELQWTKTSIMNCNSQHLLEIETRSISTYELEKCGQEMDRRESIIDFIISIQQKNEIFAGLHAQAQKCCFSIKIP